MLSRSGVETGMMPLAVVFSSIDRLSRKGRKRPQAVLVGNLSLPKRQANPAKIGHLSFIFPIIDRSRRRAPATFACGHCSDQTRRMQSSHHRLTLLTEA